MTIIRPLSLFACFTLPLLAQEPAPAEKPAEEITAPAMDPAVIKKNVSYYFGYSTGVQFSRQTGGSVLQEDIHPEEFIKAFMDAMQEKEQALSEEDLKATMDAFSKIVEARETAVAEKNLATEKTFLAENGKREGVTTTKSGLQYEVIEKGGDTSFATQAEDVKENPEFKIIYKGILIDGTVFDQSPGKEPIAINLQVIEGFKEALTTMPIGSKWKVYVPSALGYGDQRAGGQIGPNSLLIFELTMVDIVKAAPAPQGQFPDFSPQQPEE